MALEDPDDATGLDTFGQLVEAVARCVDAGRFPRARTVGADELAVELWAMNHGLVSLQLAGLLPPAQALRHLEQSARSLFLAWGDDGRATARSFARARKRLAAPGV